MGSKHHGDPKVKICVINQGAGLGDILWEQKIAHHYNSIGYKVIWPVVEEYEAIGDYIKSDWCEFVRLEKDDYPFKNIWDKSDIPVNWPGGHIYLPLSRINSHWNSQPVMLSKYSILNMDWHDWKDYINYVPNITKTEQLKKLIGVPNKDYAIVNNMFGSPGAGILRVHMNVTSKLPIVNVKMVEGFNILDWIPIILEAREVHTVDTGFCFLVEKYSENQRLCMYERQAEIFYHISGIFNKWEMISHNGSAYEVMI